MRKAWKAVLIGALATAAWAGPGERGGGAEGHGPRHHGRGGGPGGGGLGGLDHLHPGLLRELGLSEDQQKRLKEQRLGAQKTRIALQAEKSTLELDLKQILSTHPVKEAEAAKVAGKIADVDRKALLLRVETLGRFLAGLTPEQHRKLMERQEEMREKRKAWREEMRKGWKGGRPDGDGGGPDDRKGE